MPLGSGRPGAAASNVDCLGIPSAVFLDVLQWDSGQKEAPPSPKAVGGIIFVC